MSCSNFESSLKMKYPRAPVLCATKSSAESKYAYMQPHHLPLVFAFVCMWFFLQLCPVYIDFMFAQI